MREGVKERRPRRPSQRQALIVGKTEDQISSLCLHQSFIHFLTVFDLFHSQTSIRSGLILR